MLRSVQGILVTGFGIILGHQTFIGSCPIKGFHVALPFVIGRDQFFLVFLRLWSKFLARQCVTSFRS
jgi:hypothetical protein